MQPDWLQDLADATGKSTFDATDFRPVDYFECPFPTDFLETLCIETNRYYAEWAQNANANEQIKKAFTDVDIAEMKAFIAILIMMGLSRRRSYKSHWSTHWLLDMPGLRSVMTRDRFFTIPHSANDPVACCSLASCVQHRKGREHWRMHDCVQGACVHAPIYAKEAKQVGPKKLGHGRIRDCLCIQLDALHRQRRRRRRGDGAGSTSCHRTDRLSTRWSHSVLRQFLLQRDAYEDFGRQGTGFVWNRQSKPHWSSPSTPAVCKDEAESGFATSVTVVSAQRQHASCWMVWQATSMLADKHPFIWDDCQAAARQGWSTWTEREKFISQLPSKPTTKTWVVSSATTSWTRTMCWRRRASSGGRKFCSTFFWQPSRMRTCFTGLLQLSSWAAVTSAYSWQSNCSKAMNAAVSCLADPALPMTLHCGCLSDTSSSIVASRPRNVLFAQSDKMASACDVNVLHLGAKRAYNQSPCVPCPASRYTTQRETSGATTSSSCRWSDADYVT